MNAMVAGPAQEGAVIEIRLERISQLFNMLDPFPFRERDLDAAAEAFIVDWARELPPRVPLAIRIHLPAAEASSVEAHGLPDALRNNFAHQVEARSVELAELFRIGRISLVIGGLVLALCLGAAGLVAGDRFEGLGSFVAEGLLILGWVALWRPMEIFLYEWWPIARQRRLLRRLAAAQVQVQTVQTQAHAPARAP